MCSPLTSPPPFPSILDAILHYYPVKSSPPVYSSPASPSHIAQTHVPNVSFQLGSTFAAFYTPPPSRFLNPQPTIQAPTALPALTHHQSQPPSPHKSKSPGGRERMAGFSKSFSDEASGLSPSSAAKSSKLSPSPARHHGLNALSPLQAFSPLQTLPLPVKDKSQSSGTDSPKTHTRSSSLTRSLSRRQSLIANAEKWGRGEEEENRGDIGSLFSRITLVKAPAEETTLKR